MPSSAPAGLPVTPALPRTDGGDPLQYPLCPVDNWVIDEFAVELDRCTAFGFGLGEGAGDALSKCDFRVTRRENPVYHRDLVGMDAHLPLKAEAERSAGRGF